MGLFPELEFRNAIFFSRLRIVIAIVGHNEINRIIGSKHHPGKGGCRLSLNHRDNGVDGHDIISTIRYLRIHRIQIDGIG